MPIFISYSHNNSDFATELAAQLVVHRARVWIDKWELNVGDSIIDKIQNAIEGASALLVVLSRDSVESEWCKKELNAGLIRELDEKRVIVLPVLIEDCKIPMFLRDKVYADFRNDYDEGLQQVLSAVASVTSDTLGRHIGDELHMDWSIDDSVYIDGMFAPLLTIVQHTKSQPYTILTQMQLVGDELFTRRHQMYLEANLGWFHVTMLFCILAEIAKADPPRVVLSDAYEKSVTLAFRDTKSTLSYVAKISSRRLGMDTGKDILLDIAGLLDNVCTALRETNRPLTDVERRKWEEIKAQPIS